MIVQILSKKKATVKELQHLCGYLNFLTRAIFPGCVFTCRMYAKFAGVTYSNLKPSTQKVVEANSVPRSNKQLKPHHHIHLDEEFKLDCKVWLEFLDMKSASVVNWPMIDVLTVLVDAQDIGFFWDASANPELVFGCIIKNKRWLGEQWEPGYIDMV